MIKTMLQLLLVLALITGCSKNDSKVNNEKNNKQVVHNGFIQYYPKDSSYTISFPEEWEVKKGRQSFQLMALSQLADSTDKFREDVIVFIEQYPKDVKTIDDYLKFTNQHMAKLLKNFKKGSAEKFDIKDAEGRKFEYTFTLNKNIKNKCLAYVVAKNKKAYVVLASALDSTYENFKPLFEKIDSTFQVIK